MARKIEVTPELLEKAAQEIETLAQDYQSQYNQLYSETGAMASSWSGRDNLAFVNRIDGFKDDFKKMYDLMIKYADFLRTSAEAYRTTQDNVVLQAQKLVN